MCSGRSGAKSNEAPMVVCGVQRRQRLREIPSCACVGDSGKRGKPLVQQPREHSRAFLTTFDATWEFGVDCRMASINISQD